MSSNNDEQKAGMLRKRGSRMRNWSSRYVILNGPKLSYKVKADSPTVRGTFDLAPGCIITEVLEDSMGIKGKKLFSFWIVWPHDKHDKLTDEKSVTQTEESDDDEHEDDVHFKPKHRGLKHIIQSEIMNNKKDLKHIVQSEMLEQRLQQQKVEEEIERHQKYDYNISLGKKAYNMTFFSTRSAQTSCFCSVRMYFLA
jgi:hypothetical protein